MSVASVRKAFELLLVLSREQVPIPLRRLTAETRLPKPTVYRLLQTMKGMGFVSQDEDSGFYAMGENAALLAAGKPHIELRAAARPLLEQLHGQFDETVNLGVRDDLQVRYLEFLETAKPLRLVSRPGETDPIHSTALGRAILAALPEREAREIVTRCEMRALTPRTVVDAEEILRRVNRARIRGWSEESGENNEGVVCLGFSLAPWGYPTGAVSVSIPAVRFNHALRNRIVAVISRMIQKAGGPAGGAG